MAACATIHPSGLLVDSTELGFPGPGGPGEATRNGGPSPVPPGRLEGLTRPSSHPESGVSGLLEARNDSSRHTFSARRSNVNISAGKAFGEARWASRRSFPAEISRPLYQAEKARSGRQRGALAAKAARTPTNQHVFAGSFPGSLFGASARGPSARG